MCLESEAEELDEKLLVFLAEVIVLIVPAPLLFNVIVLCVECNSGLVRVVKLNN